MPALHGKHFGFVFRSPYGTIAHTHVDALCVQIACMMVGKMPTIHKRDCVKGMGVSPVPYSKCAILTVRINANNESIEHAQSR